MAAAQSENTRGNNDFYELVGRLAVTTLTHPLELVKVLIQLGHEPLPARPGYTFFGKPCILLPGFLEYSKHIRQVDGFSGLYRGLSAKLWVTLVSGSSYAAVMDMKCLQVPKPTSIEINPDYQEDDLEEVHIFLRRMLRDSVARSISIIVSHPFQVVAVRKMAQFIAREEAYGYTLSAVVNIYHEEGFAALFKGLTPRLIADMFSMWLTAFVTYGCSKYIIKDKTFRSYFSASLSYFSLNFTYPLSLVSNIMAVNNCRMIVGQPPYTPIYNKWGDCWSHLSQMNELKRGQSVIWRYQNSFVYKLPGKHLRM